jgi:hypothetical protein
LLAVNAYFLVAVFHHGQRHLPGELVADCVRLAS